MGKIECTRYLSVSPYCYIRCQNNATNKLRVREFRHKNVSYKGLCDYYGLGETLGPTIRARCILSMCIAGIVTCIQKIQSTWYVICPLSLNIYYNIIFFGCKNTLNRKRFLLHFLVNYFGAIFFMSCFKPCREAHGKNGRKKTVVFCA